MKVLHVIPGVAPRYGGPSAAVLALCRALSERGVDTTLLTTDADGRQELEVRLGVVQMYEGVKTVFFRRRLGDGFKYSPGLSRWLGRHVQGFDLVHVHAVFSHSSLAAARACRRAAVPYVVRPLGSLSPWGLEQHAVRKRVLWDLAVRNMLSKAAALHFTTTEEQRLAEGLKELAPGFVVPLGLDDASLRRDVRPADAREPVVVALGRLHPVKNLELLVEAFRAAGSMVGEPWRLVVAGDGDAGYRAHLEALARSTPSEGTGAIDFVGWVDQDAKTELLDRASLFAQPSFQENFGLSLLEALASAVPAIVTPTVNLATMIETGSAGWVVEPTVSAWTSRLADAMSDPDARTARAVNARRLAGRFTWSRVAAELEGQYGAIALGGSSGPATREAGSPARPFADRAS